MDLEHGTRNLKQGTPDAELRLGLYRRAARALERFFARFTGHFCRDCLEVTRRHHRGDPRADVDLVEGRFPGCCHAGMGEALWVPRSGDDGRFSPELAEAMARARSTLPGGPPEPEVYRVRERRSGIVATGVACRHLGPEGCLLGDLKSPLCVSYLCDAARSALAAAAGWDILGADADDFAGARGALSAAVRGDYAQAEREVVQLEVRLASLADRIDRWEAERGTTTYDAYASSENGTRPSLATR